MGGYVFNYCQPLKCSDSENIYRPWAANWYAQYAAALLHAVHRPHYMIRHCMAGMQGVSSTITGFGFAFHYI